jgi:hypothetical protein
MTPTERDILWALGFLALACLLAVTSCAAGCRADHCDSFEVAAR